MFGGRAMISSIVKRDGREAPFELDKIAAAVDKAFTATGQAGGSERSALIALEVQSMLEGEGTDKPSVEQIQDAVEAALIRNGHVRTAKAYILYRAERSRVRDMNTRLMQVYRDITFQKSSESDIKRENANIDGDTAMGTMLKYGSEGAKQFYELYVLKPEHARAHREGDIHIHDMDFLTLTTTCCQIDLHKLFTGGFSTGHGVLREPKDIHSYAALACIAIQSNQNDQHGGQSVASFDYGLAPGVSKTFARLYRQNIGKALALLCGAENADELVSETTTALSGRGLWVSMSGDEAYQTAEKDALAARGLAAECVAKAQAFARDATLRETDRATFQAMEALVHNLNTMNSRAGAQTPFSSINYGMDTSPEGRMVIKNVLLATESGLGRGETPIFPIQIFRVKEGVSFSEGDPNYDLFKLACRVSAKRLYPNFSFQDAPFNLKYYVPNRPETEIAYMGCRTRVMGNVYDPSREVSPGRGNLSFTSINLPRLALKSGRNIEVFFEMLDRVLDTTIEQLNDRFEIQARKTRRNYPFLMGQGVWMDSEKLGEEDEVREVLKHGTLSIGFIGLAEALVALTGGHHGQSATAQNLGLEIVGHMRARCDAVSKERKMNYTLLATPAEGLSGRFVKIDRKRFGSVPGVTDRDYYTNSFHIPVYHSIGAYDKINLEAPYHALTNAGHITYVELDGDPSANMEAFEAVLRTMHKAGIGYGAVNHPIDHDPVCGHIGIIGDVCPRCGRSETEDAPFERIRRVTGYLAGMGRFNNAKRAEERDRLKHRC